MGPVLPRLPTFPQPIGHCPNAHMASLHVALPLIMKVAVGMAKPIPFLPASLHTIPCGIQNPNVVLLFTCVEESVLLMVH